MYLNCLLACRDACASNSRLNHCWGIAGASGSGQLQEGAVQGAACLGGWQLQSEAVVCLPSGRVSVHSVDYHSAAMHDIAVVCTCCNALRHAS